MGMWPSDPEQAQDDERINEMMRDTEREIFADVVPRNVYGEPTEQEYMSDQGRNRSEDYDDSHEQMESFDGSGTPNSEGLREAFGLGKSLSNDELSDHEHDIAIRDEIIARQQAHIQQNTPQPQKP